MTLETAKRIAKHTSSDEVQKWSSNVMKFATSGECAACGGCQCGLQLLPVPQQSRHGRVHRRGMPRQCRAQGFATCPQTHGGGDKGNLQS